ncbi:MAG: bifunctional phosphopantothenoylcysteine decarboxylase/phosphopantothenate--cysteine ligase CoaBC [Actinomycetia bacterium]|nr:bifunctional phosphopantothenoylcysteine decarboxylase/phosphopantothenate--cysteine ligase CoaBC [Actinomycetes bacterium]
MAKADKPTVLLGVTGCIAAYKACEILRLLQKAGADVQVVMTPAAAELVGPATFRALSQHPVALAPFDEHDAPIHHIALAQLADVFLIAPATANTINKLAAGIADNLLTTTALATTAPLIIAPAMNVHMWRDSTTQAALATLAAAGVQIIEPETGYLACGEEGEGRLADVNTIAERTLAELQRSRDLSGRRLLVTAGPTREYLDPVRFISSPASGLTGYLLAEEAARRGAAVWLVSGPSDLPAPFDVEMLAVTSAQEMLAAAQQVFSERQPDAAIFTAAVADFRPETRSEQKRKKAVGSTDHSRLSVEFVTNPDILATLAAQNASQKTGCYMVGFAAESEDLLANAQLKLRNKAVDLIVANNISQPGLGFAADYNSWQLVSPMGVEETGVQSKRALVRLLLDRIQPQLR